LNLFDKNPTGRGTEETRKSKPQTYRWLNRVALGAVLYLLAQPLVFLKLGPFLPEWLTTCSSVRYFGRPCPLCGITRGLCALLHGRVGEASAYNILSLPVAALLGIELCYRLYASFGRLPERSPSFLARWDRRLHLALLAGFVAYSGWFYAH